eukprot:1183393-Prorocentrum_minimum.AAC.7
MLRVYIVRALIAARYVEDSLHTSFMRPESFCTSFSRTAFWNATCKYSKAAKRARCRNRGLVGIQSRVSQPQARKRQQRATPPAPRDLPRSPPEPLHPPSISSGHIAMVEQQWARVQSVHTLASLMGAAPEGLRFPTVASACG